MIAAVCLVWWHSLSAAARPGSVQGVLKAPTRLVARPVKSPGFWAIPNGVLNVLPPLRGVEQAMVVALQGGLRARQPKRTRLRIADSQFNPPLLAIWPKMSVKFTNDEKTLHLLESDDLFQGKRVGPGDTFEYRFEKPGTYQISCSEVPHLRATVLVAREPRLTIASRGGAFTFGDVPAGAYTLRVWYRGKWIHSQPIAVRGPKTAIEVPLPPSVAEE